MAKLKDNVLIWACTESVVVATCGYLTSRLVAIAEMDAIARSLTPTTILLSVALGVSIQLWSKLNDLSALTSLMPDERARLATQVKLRVRSLVFLVTFFVAFIFLVLTSAALSTSTSVFAEPLVIGTGAGLGACLMLIAGLMVDLNEVADFRWQVEAGDQERKRRESALALLNKPDAGFQGDEHIQGYKRVINGS